MKGVDVYSYPGLKEHIRRRRRLERRHRTVWMLRLVTWYLTLMAVALVGFQLSQAAQPHDLDCQIVGQSELYCAVVP